VFALETRCCWASFSPATRFAGANSMVAKLHPESRFQGTARPASPPRGGSLRSFPSAAATAETPPGTRIAFNIRQVGQGPPLSICSESTYSIFHAAVGRVWIPA